MNNKNAICKIDMYKNAIYKFASLNKYDLQLSEKYYQEISIHIGILFLTELNRYNKKTNITIHGYYIAYGFIKLFFDIINYSNSINFVTGINSVNGAGSINGTGSINGAGSINGIDNMKGVKGIDNMKGIKGDIATAILKMFQYISLNIEYFNSRIAPDNEIRIKINNNFHNFNIHITNKFEEIIKNNDINDKLDTFFYILLITAKFIGYGEYNEPNFIKLGQYYSRVYSIIFLNISNLKCIKNIFEKQKNILIDALTNLNMLNDTINELISYLATLVL